MSSYSFLNVSTNVLHNRSLEARRGRRSRPTGRLRQRAFVVSNCNGAFSLYPADTEASRHQSSDFGAFKGGTYNTVTEAAPLEDKCVCCVATLPPQTSLVQAGTALHDALLGKAARFGADVPRGVIRLEVPVPRSCTALRWLRGQVGANSLGVFHPQVYFSPRRSSAPDTAGSTAATAASAGAGSVAGVGAAWLWKGADEQPLDDAVVKSMRRFLGASNARLRVFGGSRFDPQKAPSPEWKEFGSYFFMLPRLEYMESSGCCLLACTVAWDTGFSLGKATNVAVGFSSVQAAVADAVAALKRLRPPAAPAAPSPASCLQRISTNHVPDESSWKAYLDSVHARLISVKQFTDPNASNASSNNVSQSWTIDPNIALDEYLRNGQQGLDGLLAALENGFETVLAGTIVDGSDGSDIDSSGFDGPSSPSAGDVIAVEEDKSPKSDLSKVVLARRTGIDVAGKLDPIVLLEALQERDPRAYQTLLRLPSGVTFVASTPECLYTRTGNAIASEAVAGTRARGPGGDVEKDFWLALDLLQSEKDDVEFGVVREWVRRALGTVCDDVRVEVTKSVLKQGAVQHLYGKLAGRIRPGVDDAALLGALHPTPAVCGQPRSAGLAVLSDVEPFDRGFYAGPFGWISSNAAEFVVAIRSALIRSTETVRSVEMQNGNGKRIVNSTGPARTNVFLYAGVGIVKGSDALSEWAELNLKISQFERFLVPPMPAQQAPNVAALWARLAVEELCRLGCNTFCVAPGSRSSPLTTAIAMNPRARIVPCIDERSLGFWALGYGRASGMPAVVVTSSGTAVANLLPSVVEASQSDVPLLLLTADRPQELRDTGANQTIDQVGIFGKYVRWECDVQSPTDVVPARSILTTIDTAVRCAVGGDTPGPVHLNLQFREPLTPASVPWDASSSLAGLERWLGESRPFTTFAANMMMESSSISLGARQRHGSQSSFVDAAVSEVLSVISSARRGLIVVGELTAPEDSAAVVMLAQALGWPVAADVLSGIRVGASTSAAKKEENFGIALVPHFDHLLLDRTHWPALRPDVILQLGGHLTSKRVQQFMEWSTRVDPTAMEESASWIFVDRSLRRHDQSHLVSHRLQAPVTAVAAALLSLEPHKGRKHLETLASYRNLLDALDGVASAAVDSTIENFTELTEPAVARLLSREIPPGEALFIGNSMPVRDLDMYGVPVAGRHGVYNHQTRRHNGFPSKNKDMRQATFPSGVGTPVGANRGASGIDGVLSTAAGFADGLGRGCTLVVGDISFLHDVNGLNLLRSGEMRPPLTVVLINNSGGGIFSFLPIAEHLADDVFTPLWATPQNVDLAGICRAHGIPHMKVFTTAQLQTGLQSAWGLNRHSVIEVITQRTTNVERHREIQAAVRDAVESVLRARGVTPFKCSSFAATSPLNTASPSTDSPKIIGASIRPFKIPLRRPLTSVSTSALNGSNGCRCGFFLLLDIKVSGPGGIRRVTGVGEVAPLPGLHAESLDEVRAQLGAVCHMLTEMGTLPGSVTELHDWTNHLLGPFSQKTLYSSVQFGLEGAVISALATARGVPMYAILAEGCSEENQPIEVLVNALLDPGANSSPESAAQKASELVCKGYKCLKVKVGRRPHAAEDAAVINAIRKSVGPDVKLRADANGAWSLEQAVEFGRLVAASADLEYVEDPVGGGMDDVAEFYRRTGVPVALDEALKNLIDVSGSQRSALPSGTVALAIKPASMGGFLQALQLAKLARDSRAVAVITSAFESTLGLQQLAHLGAAIDALQGGTTYHGLATDAWLDCPQIVTQNAAQKAIILDGSDKPWEDMGTLAWSLSSKEDTGSNKDTPSRNRLHESTAHVTAAGFSYSLRVLQISGTRSKSIQGNSTPRVLFLHGFLGQAEGWVPLMYGMASLGCHVSAVDLPGHGHTKVFDPRMPIQSSRVSETIEVGALKESASAAAYSLEAAGAAIAQLITLLEEPLCSRKTIVVGYSLGARLALLLAAARPDLIEGVVAVSGTPGLSDTAQREERAVQDSARAATLRAQGIDKFLHAWYDAPMWSTLRANPQGLSQLIARRAEVLKGKEGPLSAALEYMSPGRAPAVWEDLHRLAQSQRLPRVLCVVGDKDEKFARTAGELHQRLEDVCPGISGVAVVEGCGHAVHLERPLSLLETLVSFLQKETQRERS